MHLREQARSLVTGLLRALAAASRRCCSAFRWLAAYTSLSSATLCVLLVSVQVFPRNVRERLMKVKREEVDLESRLGGGGTLRGNRRDNGEDDDSSDGGRRGSDDPGEVVIGLAAAPAASSPTHGGAGSGLTGRREVPDGAGGAIEWRMDHPTTLLLWLLWSQS